MKKEMLEKMFSISLKSRILREWQKSNRAEKQEFTERELLTLELINDFGPITEKSLSKIFGIAFSSVSDLVGKLREAGLIETSEKTRGQPLSLTPLGKDRLANLKQTSAVRFSYLFESLEEAEFEALMKIFEKLDKNAEKSVQQLVFDRYAVEDEVVKS